MRSFLFVKVQKGYFLINAWVSFIPKCGKQRLSDIIPRNWRADERLILSLNNYAESLCSQSDEKGEFGLLCTHCWIRVEFNSWPLCVYYYLISYPHVQPTTLFLFARCHSSSSLYLARSLSLFLAPFCLLTNCWLASLFFILFSLPLFPFRWLCVRFIFSLRRAQANQQRN